MPRIHAPDARPVTEIRAVGRVEQYSALMPEWPLIGRAEELSAVLAFARGAGVVLAGAAGVGKSRLAREVLARARPVGRGRRYVTATATARSVPLGAFAEYATHLGNDPLARIGEVVDAVAADSSSSPPVVLIDDAQLLDEQSALVVHQMVRRHSASVVLTLRAGEPAPDAITALWKDQLLPRLELQPLSRIETAELLEAVLGSPVESASADRLWHYTRGNVLYLRQLLSDELTVEHLRQKFGVWIWDAEPVVSPTLAELIDANIGRHSEFVIEVLNVLSVADPLELDVLRAIVSDSAIEQAEAANLIAIDTRAAHLIARLAHPMYGEVRRSRASAIRLRRLRGEIVAALPRPEPGTIDEVGLVRRSLLAIDSDTPLDPTLLIDASDAAIRLMGPIAAEKLARRAVENGGGFPAQLTLMNALVNGERLNEALALNAELLVAASTKTVQVALGLIRIGIFTRQNDRVAARQIEQWEVAAAEAGMSRLYNSVLAVVCTLNYEYEAAVEAAFIGLIGAQPIDNAAEFAAIFGLLTASGELGRISTIREFADRGYVVARSSAHTAGSRFILGACHVAALLLAGLIDEATRVTQTRFDEEPLEFPLVYAYHAFTAGLIARAHGDLASAKRVLGEAGARVNHEILDSCIKFELGATLAMSGAAEDAAVVVSAISPDDPVRQALAYVDIAEAWMKAARGLVGEAVDILIRAARRARAVNARAREVYFLQTAAQFGDASGADRLAELVLEVEGPRASAAAAHARALRTRDGDGLLAAARSYEAFGDRVAAADAAAQAAVAYRRSDRRGAALTATTFARRLADETGADTPALRANDTPIPLTGRQREIIALAGHGLSNREIAERLTMSVRTVEGHLFRACQRTGVNRREDLIALLRGK